MTTRERVLLKISFVLLASIALSGCVHYQGTMADCPMHHMAKQSARLDELVDAMNAAEDTAKVDAIAAVVNEMVDQRARAYGCRRGAAAAGACRCPVCPRASESCFMD